ncbi:hypothetical protein CDL15_Pgr004525 [Punica granatum]|uniref:Uncharacterized protein n=1 Tax=Punica granatum TaxID=22663 RepID=A0A218WQL0_PUNGR|nr:hypothetical protein CDL15_Pgr004525 [Punica granatum]PKI53876.1 hypothetical protein CRG98_025734 [Punica granatum]
MGGRYRLLLVAVLLALSVSHGFGRRLMGGAAAEYEDDSVILEETEGKSRMMIELMDYPGPGANPSHTLNPPPPPSEG